LQAPFLQLLCAPFPSSPTPAKQKNFTTNNTNKQTNKQTKQTNKQTNNTNKQTKQTNKQHKQTTQTNKQTNKTNKTNKQNKQNKQQTTPKTKHQPLLQSALVSFAPSSFRRPYLPCCQIDATSFASR
jgi:septal ring factor EnvC (AmiA/AmiB activator)